MSKSLVCEICERLDDDVRRCWYSQSGVIYEPQAELTYCKRDSDFNRSSYHWDSLIVMYRHERPEQQGNGM